MIDGVIGCVKVVVLELKFICYLDLVLWNFIIFNSLINFVFVKIGYGCVNVLIINY